jgi:hypothetical protein
MNDQDDITETVEIRFVVKGRPGELKILAAKWMQSNKFEALDFLAQARKSEILAGEGEEVSQVQVARIESMAFFRYLMDVLNARIAAQRGEIPDINGHPISDKDSDDEGFIQPPKKSTGLQSNSSDSSNDILSNL